MGSDWGYILLWLVLVAVSAWIAIRKGRNPVIWGALSIILTWIAVVILLLLPKVEKQEGVLRQGCDGTKNTGLVVGGTNKMLEVLQARIFRRCALLIGAYWLVVCGYFFITEGYEFYDMGIFYQVALVPPAISLVIFAGFKKFWE